MMLRQTFPFRARSSWAGRLVFAAVVLAALGGSRGVAQPRPVAAGPVVSDRFKTTYIRLGAADEALLYEPVRPGPRAHFGLVLTHPDGNTFNATPVVEMALRGYRVLAVNHHGNSGDVVAFGQPLARAIGYLRTLPGVDHVLLMGHSGGAEVMSWYANVAEHGAAACDGPEKIYPCSSAQVAGLPRPDGVILLDSPLGAFHAMSAIDPAVEGNSRNASLDMFAAQNGYDPAQKEAHFSQEFASRFYAAQSRRSNALIGNATGRLQAIQQGHGQFSDDEPLIVRGMGAEAAGARLYQPDPAFAASTSRPHTLLKADGTDSVEIVHSVRPPTGQQFASALDALHVMNQETTVRQFLASSAIRTSADYAIAANRIVGVDWHSAVNSPPANAEGILVPSLVLANTCHYLVVPDEIVFDHLGSKDKTLVYVEGSTHNFTPCRPVYGDTTRRAFDAVDLWLSKPGRFSDAALRQ